MNISKFFSEHGHSVTIYATINPYSSNKKIGEDINIIYFRKIINIPIISKLFGFLYRIKLGTLTQLIDMTFFFSQYFIHILKNKKLTIFHNMNIGVDARGSILAWLKNCFFKENYIYLSLELEHPSTFKCFARIINVLDRFAYRKSECVIIQDEDRFKTLCEYHKYQHPKVFYVPNSTSSSEFPSQDDSKNYFREIFCLSEKASSCIILQAGMICDITFSKELASAFTSINNGCILVFHDRIKHKQDEPYIKLLREINARNLFLSLEPLPYEQIDKIFSSATIGLAFYRGRDENFSQISKASGKLSFYLKHGKPVLVNNLASLSALVEKYKIGLVIIDPSNPIEIKSAIDTILNDYAFYSNNARRCFEEEYDFSRKIKPVLSFINYV